MMVARYPTKKALKEAVGQRLRYQETSFFGDEWAANGTVTVVGPSAHERKWFANVTLASGVIVKVR